LKVARSLLLDSRSSPQPANLLVDSNFTVKVADFGFALIKRQQWPDGKQPVAKGTPIYAAPEVLLGRTFDEKADVYSFGMVLWEMFMVEFPWAATSTLKEHVRNVCVKNERPPLPPDCPATLRDLICAAWHLAPDKRPSFEDMLPKFDPILVESALRDGAAQRFWKAAFPEEQRIPLPRFVSALADFFNVRVAADDLQCRCVGALLEDASGDVSLEAFANMVEWFAPFQDGFLPRLVVGGSPASSRRRS
jgi:serine/threonine protein kinase